MLKGSADSTKRDSGSLNIKAQPPASALSNAARSTSVSHSERGEDDLQLRLLSKNADTKSVNFGISEELVDHLNEEICGLKNECARLYNLLREKDMELKRMKKISEETEAAGVNGVTNEVVAVKIVEMSKRIRELSSELQSERTRSKQTLAKLRDLELANKNGSLAQVSTTKANSQLGSPTIHDEEKLENEMKVAMERARIAEAKVTELRNQLEEARREGRVAIKVLSQEVGDGIDVHTLLRSEGQAGWKGRAQQIQLLQKKLADLKAASVINSNSNFPANGDAVQGIRHVHTANDLSDLDSFVSGTGDLSSSRHTTANNRHIEALKRMEKERRSEQDRLIGEKVALERDLDDTKQRLTALKARNKTLQEDVKSLRERVEQLLEKSRHDDEFVQVLLKQQETLRQTVLSPVSRQQVNSVSSATSGKIRTITERTVIVSNGTQQPADRVADLEATVLRLQQELEQNRAFARSKTSDSMSQTECELLELRGLLQAAKLECSRLTDIVRNLHDQLDKTTEERLVLNSELLANRKEQVLLEKQLGKLKLELEKATGRGGDLASQRHRTEVSLSELDDLRAKVDVLTEERTSYRMALEKSAQQRKAELSLYENLLDETKRIFAQSVRQLARKTINSSHGSGIDNSSSAPEITQQ